MHVSTTHIYYSDPNYLSSNEFSSYEDITKNDPSDVVYSDNDTTNYSDTINVETENFSTDDYYDFSFSSRIKRFHNLCIIQDTMVIFILTIIGIMMIHFFGEVVFIMDTTGIHHIIHIIVILHFIITIIVHIITEIIFHLVIIFITTMQITIHILIHTIQ